MPPLAWLGVGLALAGTGVTVIQAANSAFWLLFGWVLTVAGVACLALSGAGTARLQKALPRAGRLRWVPDHDFRVIPGHEVDEHTARLETALAEGEAAREAPKPGVSTGVVTFAEIEPRIEGYIEEARAFYVELAGEPVPARTGGLYDEIQDWQRRVYADLNRYHRGLAHDFSIGGFILSPQLSEVQPTDKGKLQIVVRRRGQVLRNVLDGTPGKGLERKALGYSWEP